MMKLGTETGSLINHVMSQSHGATMPQVGMGATICGWSDRHAATIVKVTECQIYVQRDRVIRTDSNGMSESQHYDYAADPLAPVEIFRRTKRGWRNKGGRSLSIGHRSEFYDYSF